MTINYQLGSGKSVTDKEYLEVIDQEITYFFDKFRPNHQIYRKAYWFVFGSSISDMDKKYANLKKRYALEINNLGSVITNISTQINEFPPSVTVQTDDFKSNDATQLMEHHFRYVIQDANNRNVLCTALEQVLFGFSFIKISVGYKSQRSMDREIKLYNVDDVCNVGFDLLARDTNKGRYFFEVMQVPVFELKNKFPGKADEIEIKKYSSNYTSYLSNFRNYDTTVNSEMTICVIFYERVTKQSKRILLDDGTFLWEEEYKATLKKLEEMGVAQYMPNIVRAVTRERVEMYETIAMSDLILSKKKCQFEEFPYVYLDGNSRRLVKDEIEIKSYKFKLLLDAQAQYISQGNNQIYSPRGEINVIQPFIKQAMDPQRLMNQILQEFYNELDGRPAQSLMFPIDGDNLDIVKKLKNQEIPQIVPIKTRDEMGNPIQAPLPLQRPPIDPSVTQALPVVKNLLSESTGDFSQEMARNLPDQVSGVGVRELLALDKTQAKPYINNFIKGLNDLFDHAEDIAVSVLQDERTVTGVNESSDKFKVPINEEGAVNFTKDKDFSVFITVDINEEIHNRMDYQAAMQLAQINPQFNSFIGSKGFSKMIQLSNIKDSDMWIKEYNEYLDEISKQPPQPTQIDLAMKQLEIEKENVDRTHEEREADLQLKAYKTGADVTAELANIDLKRQDQLLRAGEINAERERTRADLWLKALKGNR